MTAPHKYIILKDSKGDRIPVIFGERLAHMDMAEVTSRMMAAHGFPVEPVSAGYCTVGEVRTSGMSDSLNLKPHPDDEQIIAGNNTFRTRMARAGR